MGFAVQPHPIDPPKKNEAFVRWPERDSGDGFAAEVGPEAQDGESEGEGLVFITGVSEVLCV